MSGNTFFPKTPPTNAKVETWVWKAWFQSVWRAIKGSNYVYYRLGVGSVFPERGPELKDEYVAINYNSALNFILPPAADYAHKPYVVIADKSSGGPARWAGVAITSGSGDVIRDGYFTSTAWSDLFDRGDQAEFRSDGVNTWFLMNYKTQKVIMYPYLNTDYAVAAAVAIPGAVIPFANVALDRFTYWNAGTYSYTAIGDGIYDIRLHLEAQQTAGAAPSELRAYINVNGTNIAQDVNNNGGRNRDAGAPITCQVDHTVFLTRGDVVKFYFAWTGAGAAGTLNGGVDPRHSWAGITKQSL